MTDAHIDCELDIFGGRPDHMEEECGVFGVWAPDEDVARLTYFGLQALQHRGQESAGIAVGDGKTVTVVKNLGLVTQVFEETDLKALPGNVAIGHVRYSTTGASNAWENAQPHMSSIGRQLIALAHNGSLVNTQQIREELDKEKVYLNSSTDSEAFAALINIYTQQTSHIREGIANAMKRISGSYAVTLITEDALYAFRDPMGVRPLCLGRLSHETGYVISSETCGLDIVGAEFIREIEPGEVIKISENGVETLFAIPSSREAMCMFEYVYFARPDSEIRERSMYQVRRLMGERLAQEAPVEGADMVMGVPDSGLPAAVGFAQKSGIPYGDGLMRNRYVGRTFIAPSQSLRQLGIRMKLNPMRHEIEGKSIVVVDDSIVRGNTMKQITKMLRDFGAREIHLRIISPQVLWPCYFGIDIDSREHLIAANKSLDEIREHVGADSLAYLSLEGMAEATGFSSDRFCLACFNGEYPVDIPEEKSKHSAC